MELPTGKKIILFDGVCNFCNDKINYVIEHDKQDVFRFVSLQSTKGQEIINYLGVNNAIDSIIFIRTWRSVLFKIGSCFKIIKHLSSSVKLLLIFTFVPNFIKNIFYDLIAKNRYNWFGKKESCMIPTPELKAKFIE